MAKITQEKIDGIFDSYLEKQTAVHVSEQENVSLTTAKKYIMNGSHSQKFITGIQKRLTP